MATPITPSTRPNSNEYAEYYDRYVSLVPEGDIVVTLERQLDSTLALLRSIDESTACKRYAPDKWSIKEVVGHMIDAERVFIYRALCFARNDNTPIAGFEQDDYVRNAKSDQRQLADLASEFDIVRKGSISLFRTFDDEEWSRIGRASDAECSVRALAYMIAGHEVHHINVLKTRYL